jgi:hypothetical protein
MRAMRAGLVIEPCSHTIRRPAASIVMPLAALASGRIVEIAPGATGKRPPSSWTRRIATPGPRAVLRGTLVK